MTARPGFLLDENIDPAVADGLRQNGLNAHSARELGLLGASDHEIMERAVEYGRILVTRDLPDFPPLVRLHLGAGRSIPGVLLVPPSIPPQEPGALIEAIIRWNNRYGALEQIAGGIAWLTISDLQDGDQQVQETRPGYMRALERIGAII
ncbi:DUF5615 family PIN-like protein [Gemmatimonadota bacterium]